MKDKLKWTVQDSKHLINDKIFRKTLIHKNQSVCRIDINKNKDGLEFTIIEFFDVNLDISAISFGQGMSLFLDECHIIEAQIKQRNKEFATRIYKEIVEEGWL